MRLSYTSRVTAVLRTVLARPHLLEVPVVLASLLVASVLVVDDERADAVVDPVAPPTGTAASWNPLPWLSTATPAVPIPADVGPLAPQPPAPGQEVAGSTPAPTGRAPSEPVVNEPPPRPNRVAPAPPEGEPPRPPRPGSVAVHPGDFPDPFVLHARGVYWAFSTESGGTQVPTLRSVDLVDWTPIGDALARLPAWASPGHVWAPSVLERGAAFVMYYTTRHTATGLQCISRAVSVLPQGPYVDPSSGPLICQTERGGSIDPSPFVDPHGRAWLLWKSEGTLLGEPTRIWVQELADDGQRLLGDPTPILRQELAWEFPIVEGPSMALVEGRYHLFYSANRWETADYAIGHAICASPVGPCRRTSPTPVLAAGPSHAGPGGQTLATAPTGEPVLVHHAWEPGLVGYPQGARSLYVSALRFEGERARVLGPWGRRELLSR